MSDETIHPMVMKAAEALFEAEFDVSSEDDQEEWESQRKPMIRRAQKMLTECGALECLEALERLRGEWAYQCSEGNVPEGRVEAEIADKAIAKARDVSSDGKSLCDDEAKGRVVYGSAPE